VFFGLLTKRLDHGLRDVFIADDIANGADSITPGSGVNGLNFVAVVVGGLAVPVNDSKLAPADSRIMLYKYVDNLAGRLPCG
jgi:hypothetical protein